MNTNRSLHFFTIPLVFTAVSVVFFNYSVFATDTNTSQDNVTVNVPVSCTMNGTGMSSHTASIPNGTYQANIGTTTLQSFCNDSQGFAIYAIGYTNEEYGNTNLVGLTQNQTIVTGTATSTGNPDVSNWAVKLATSSGATYPLTLDNSFGSYHTVPTDYTKVAHRDSGTDLGSSATGSTLTTTYAAYISKTQAADTYNGKVKYTLVHPASEVPAQPVACEGGKICYNPNTATAIGEMGKQTASNNSSTTLWASNFSRTGYGFAGWNTEYDYSGTTYGPQETITTPSDISANGLSLYAVWVPSNGMLQNWNGCNSLTQGAVTALTDSRDSDTYAVAKLADNKCWMIENLRLDDSAILSSSNTHNPSLPLTNVYDIGSTSNHLSPTIDPAQTAWCINYDAACIDQSMLATNNTVIYTNNTATNYNTSENVFSYGNYYNWYSATAGHGTYNNTNYDGHGVSGDICPAGWHLPRGGDKSHESTNEFWSLIVDGINNGTKPANYDNTSRPIYTDDPEGTTASNALRTYPNNFIYSGYLPGTGIRNRNSYGYYWSASANGNTSANVLFFASYFVYPGTDSNIKWTGKAIRCIAGA